MSSSDDSKPPREHDLKPLPQDPLIAQVQKSLGELFGSTIDAMRQDTVQLIKDNQSDTKIGKAIEQFTDAMLSMLADRVRQSMPAGYQAPSEKPGGNPEPTPPPPRRKHKKPGSAK